MSKENFPNNFELKFEITEQCNSNCSFCHQGYGSLRSKKEISFKNVRETILRARHSGITAVRFTGGEPSLHSELRDMVEFSFGQGMYVTVNTNGLLPEKYYEPLCPHVNMFKISLPASNEEVLDRLTGVQGAFKKKMKTIAHCIGLGTEVQLLTVIVEQNIGDLEQFIKFADGVPNLTWQPLRNESSPYNKRPVSKALIQKLAEELQFLMAKHPGKVQKLGLATPFCSVKPIELGAKVFMGRAENCGPFFSMTVTPDNEIISCYSCRNPYKKTKSFSNLKNNAEYNRLTTKKQLPGMCKKCSYLNLCLGGCAAPEALESYDGGWIDYLAIP